jgi:glycosyltransferase involved in cell wall biosynthesis
MKNYTKKIVQFDTPDTLVVVSLYPNRGETYSEGISGIASYTKNVVKNFKRPVIVLTNYTTKPDSYLEKNVLVIRCFKLGQPKIWLDVLKIIKQLKLTRQILIQFDFMMYGSLVASAGVLGFMSATRAMGFKNSIVTHSVVHDVKKLAGHMGLTNSLTDQIKAFLYNFTFGSFYSLLGIIADQVIILEKTLKQSLANHIPAQKLVAIPHGVDTSLREMSKKSARQKLGLTQNEYVVLFFGYVNWFKGADFFASTFQDIQKILGRKAQFIIAGGESVTLKKRPYYREYFKNTQKIVADSKNVTLTGYVPQQKIKEYFAAADLVVFPYRDFMCASGVMSLVFAYQKPFIVSEALSPMFAAEDFTRAFTQTGLTDQDITFALNKRSCLQRTTKVLENGLKQKMVKLGKQMKQERSFTHNAMLYEQALFENHIESNPAPATTFA